MIAENCTRFLSVLPTFFEDALYTVSKSSKTQAMFVDFTVKSYQKTHFPNLAGNVKATSVANQLNTTQPHEL